MARMIWAAATAALMLIAAPTVAQSSNPWTSGNYWDVSSIKVKPGYGLAYAKFLAESWQKNQAYAKSKGWISSYHVLANEYPREGEPDLYLVTVYNKMPTAGEDDQRAEEMRKFMQRSEEQMVAANRERAEYRTNIGTMLLREQVLR